jgi:hypothetical protein
VVIVAAIATGLKATAIRVDQPLLLVLFGAGYAVLVALAALKQRYLKALP